MDLLSFVSRGAIRMSMTSLATRGLVEQHITGSVGATDPDFFYRVEAPSNSWLWSDPITPITEFSFDWLDRGVNNRYFRFQGCGLGAFSDWSNFLTFSYSVAPVFRQPGWHSLRFRQENGVSYAYYDGVLQFSLPNAVAGGTCSINFTSTYIDFRNLKYAVGNGPLQGPFYTNGMNTNSGFVLGGAAAQLPTLTPFGSSSIPIIDALYNGDRIVDTIHL